MRAPPGVPTQQKRDAAAPAAPAHAAAVVVNPTPAPAARPAAAAAAVVASPAALPRRNFREDIKQRSRATAPAPTPTQPFGARAFWKCEHARRGDTCKLCVGEEEAHRVRAREKRERLAREEAERVRMLNRDAQTGKGTEGRTVAAGRDTEEPKGTDKARTPGAQAVATRPPSAAASGPAPVAPLSAMKVTELKEALRAHGLPTSGLKADLLQRLRGAQAPEQSAADAARKRGRDREQGGGEGGNVRKEGRPDPAAGAWASAEAKGQGPERQMGGTFEERCATFVRPAVFGGGEAGNSFCKICFGPCKETGRRC